MTWYRYHPLFRDMLLRTLRTRQGPAAVSALHARAGAWFAENGLVEEGVHHALAAGDTGAAAALVERHIDSALAVEAWQALEGWLHLLPSEVVQRRPALVLAHGWVAHRQRPVRGAPLTVSGGARPPG